MRRKRYFEWLDGELEGQVATLDYIEEEDGMVLYNFTDGEICNAAFIAPMTGSARDLNGKVMVEVNNPRDVWRSEIIKAARGTKEQYGESVEIPTLEDVLAANGQQEATIGKSSIGSKKWIAPENAPAAYPPLPTVEEYAKPAAAPRPAPCPPQQPIVSNRIEEPVPPIADREQPQIVTIPPVCSAPRTPEDPVEILVRKCKKHSTDVDLTITIDLPAKSTFDFAASEFDGGADRFITYVLSELSPSLILEALRDSLLTAYTETESVSDGDK